MAFSAGERRLFFARVKNNIEEEYTPSMTYGPGGKVVESGFVKNQDGKAYFFLTNAYDYPINIEIPVIKANVCWKVSLNSIPRKTKWR